MAKKTKIEIIEWLSQTEEGVNKIDTISGGLKNGTIKSFPQLFGTLAKTNVQTLLGGSYYTSDEKLLYPEKFTLEDIEFLADLFNVDFDIMLKFIRLQINKNRHHIRTKSRTGSKK